MVDLGVSPFSSGLAGKSISPDPKGFFEKPPGSPLNLSEGVLACDSGPTSGPSHVSAPSQDNDTSFETLPPLLEPGSPHTTVLGSPLTSSSPLEETEALANSHITSDT